MSPTSPRGPRAAFPLARLCLAVSALCAGAAHAGFLDAATQQRVRAATFEVVMLKPEDSGITYEKPLPLDLLPYQFRIDKYFSVGTAFALGGHRFGTAAHVLNLGITSQWGTPGLRDGTGRVYPIGQILKYSTSQDFAIFSLAQEPQVEPLEPGPHPALNETVYAVGNALGEGVVIRDGLYTSDTPEERDGRWKWLRFSAAASPGNSGGPLLDKDGKLIGVVLRKSPNENLNYALSIDDIQAAPDKTAVIDSRETYQLDVVDFKQTETLDTRFDLPKDYPGFSRAVRDLWYAFDDQILRDMLKNRAGDIFPEGEGATELLHSLPAGRGPGLLIRSTDGIWHVNHANSYGRAELGHNGYVAVGRLASQALIQLRRPDDVPADRFYGDSRLYMDSLLKGLPLQRSVGAENIKMTSLGPAAEDSVYTDHYGRKWQLRLWNLPFQDYKVISLALPVPEGYVALVRGAASSATHDSVNDLQAIADFAAVDYVGTLAQWQDYRRQSGLLPAALRPIDLDIDYGKRLRYSSPRLSFSYTPALQKIAANSLLDLEFGYFRDHGRTVWDVARIRASESAQSDTLIAIARNIEPARSQDDDDQAAWSKIVHHQHPFDAVITRDGDLTTIRSVHPPGATADEPDTGVLYTVAVQNDGAAAQDAMQTRLDQLMQSLSLKDELAPHASVAQAQE